MARDLPRTVALDCGTRATRLLEARGAAGALLVRANPVRARVDRDLVLLCDARRACELRRPPRALANVLWLRPAECLAALCAEARDRRCREADFGPATASPAPAISTKATNVVTHLLVVQTFNMVRLRIVPNLQQLSLVIVARIMSPC